MSLDYPNNPTNGLIYTSGGASWQWDGIKWNSYAVSTGVGTITGVIAGIGMVGGGTSGTVTLDLGNTAIFPGSFTYAGFTVDAQGRLTAASSGAPPVPLAGGTMTGLLTLSGPPTVNLGAATKQYVDTAVSGGPFLPISGGTLTGALVLPSGTVTATSLNFGTPGTGIWTSAAATQINFAAGGLNRVAISSASVNCAVPIIAPLGTVAAPSLTFVGDTTSGFFRKVAGSVSISATNSEVMNWAAASKTTTAYGPLLLAANPSAPLEATAKQYVDAADALALSITAAASTYLTIANASSTYLTIANASSTYLTIANAASTYLTIANASSTYAPLASPLFTGNPRGPTPATADSSPSLATTAWVKSQNYAPASGAGYLPLTGGTLSGLLVANAGIQANFYNTRNGTGGAYGSHGFNIDWTGSLANLWIDTVNVGAIALQSWVSGAYLPLSGGTVTGLLTISANPATINFSNPSGPGITAGNLWRYSVGPGGNMNLNLNTAAAGDFSTYNVNWFMTPAGNMTVLGSLSATALVNLTGSACAYQFQDVSGGYNWQLYATAGIARLWHSGTGAGDKLTLDGSGNLAVTGTISGTGGTLSGYLTALYYVGNQFYCQAPGTYGNVGLISGGTANTGFIEWRLPSATIAGGTRLAYMGYDPNGGRVGLVLQGPANMFTITASPSGMGAITDVRIESTSYSKISFNANSSAVDSGKWQFYAGANTYYFQTLNDAENAATNFMYVTRSGLTPTAVIFPTGALSINQYLYFANVTSGGPFLVGDTTNFVFRLGTGNGGLYVQDSGGNNRAVIDQTGRIGLTHGGLGGTTGSQIMALRSFQTDGNNDAMEFLWNRNGPTTGWGNVDFIIRRNVDNTNAQTAIFFTGTPSGPVFTVTNQGSWRYSIDITNQAWLLPSASGGYYWYNSASGQIMQLTNAGALTVAGNISTTQTVTGASVVATSGLIFSDRTAGTQWQWYGTSNIARLYNAGDKFSIDTGGSIVAFGNVTGSNFYLRNNYLCFANYTGGGAGNTLIFGDANNLVLQVAANSAGGVQIKDFNANCNLWLKADGTVWSMGTGNGGQFRMMPNNGTSGYGAFWRNDNSNVYLLLTNVNDSQGSWNGLRPFTVGTTNGYVTFGHLVFFNSTACMANNTPLQSYDTSSVARNMIWISTDNNIWIGDSSRWVTCTHIQPQSANAYYSGTASQYWYQIWTGAGGFQTGSDRRLKADFEDLPDCLDLICRLAPQRFRWNTGYDTTRTHWGFIAQDVGAVMGKDFGGYTAPEPDNPASIAGLNYNELTAVLWKACQELAAGNRALAERVAVLEARYDA